MNQIVEHLTKEVKALEEYNRFQRIGQYRSVGHFVLENGRYWTLGTKPNDLDWGELKNCFGNCTHLSMAYPDEYIYCEGFALGEFFPMLHAWCVTPEGVVVDITWRKPGIEYYGIAIKDSYVKEAVERQDHFGLVDAWQEHWPMLRIEPRLWRHPVNDAKIV